jgi:perosamine synthetase
MSSEPGLARVTEIPLSVPVIGGNEWRYVKDCLDTGWVSSAGPYVDRFEAEFAAHLGVPHAVATVNGTAALHVALRLVGVERDDEVLVSDLTFIAPANAIRYLGAWPVFVDAEPLTWQLNPHAVVRFLTTDCERVGDEVRNRLTGRRVKAILPVHILGHPVDLGPLLRVADRFSLPVVEDATESLGGSFSGQPLGTLGAVGCFSFNGNKLMTTGAGGMLVTSDPDLADRARYLTTQAKDDPVEYVHNTVGYNYRLSNVQAAIGCAQLEQLSGFLKSKRSIAERYWAGLDQVHGVQCLCEAPKIGTSALWLSAIRIDPAVYGRSSRALMRDLAARGIETRPLWTPLHRNPAFANVPSQNYFPVADQIQEEALTLPSSVGLTSDQQARVIKAIASP